MMANPVRRRRDPSARARQEPSRHSSVARTRQARDDSPLLSRGWRVLLRRRDDIHAPPALELMRLDQLEMAFEGKANKDQDPAAGALIIKILEHRTTLLGLNPPLGHAGR